MSTYIIADLHLCEGNPVLVKAFERFYDRMLLNDRLIIAGDLFDFFVGLDPHDRIQQQVRSIIKTASLRGIQTFFQCGNRDFLMDKEAAAYFHMRLLPDFYVVSTQNGAALVLHGDQLCLNDRSFQRLRTLSKNRLVRFIFMHLPLETRKKIALKLRKKSLALADERDRSPQIYGLVKAAAEQCLKRTKTKILIHGHFHKFGPHQGEFGEYTYRFALGCWEKNFSYVRCDRQHLELVQKPLDKLF